MFTPAAFTPPTPIPHFSPTAIYTRRVEGVSIWVVASSDIVASDPDDARGLLRIDREALPACDPLRHPGRSRSDVDELVLNLGDDNLVMAQRLSEWVAAAPDLELDIALANVALDHLASLAIFFSLYAELEGTGRTEDDLRCSGSARSPIS